jgi:uncharacterized protein YqjF (DUF2071 family)
VSAAEPISVRAPALVGRSVASQRWSHLALLHWRVPAAEVAPLLPPGLVPDEFDGSSWVGLIPFVLDRGSVFGSPPVPYFGTFVEVNVRLYAVDRYGRRGVVFLSLEASRLAAVIAARAAFHLPYMWSRTRLERADYRFLFTTSRHFAPRLRALVEIDASKDAVSGDPLADFLTARWALFTVVGGRVRYLRNTHEPWELRKARLVRIEDTLLEAAGFPGLARRHPDSVLYAPGVTTWFGSPID